LRSEARQAVKNLEPVTDFLDSKSIRSRITARNYLTGLTHFNGFLSPKYTVETILQPLKIGEENVYQLLSRFVVYEAKLTSSAGTIKLNLEAVKSYLQFHDIIIIPVKFKNQVTMPKILQEEKTAIDANDIRKLLLACDIRRLKTYLLILASGGMRPVEGLAIRICDIDFSVNPTKIHIRAEFAKTRVARDIYISDEATKRLRDWIDWRYRNDRPKCPDDLVFHQWNLAEEPNPQTLYPHIAEEFAKLLDVAGFAERKADRTRRHRITLKTFRDFVKSTISDCSGKEFSEWFIGHAGNPYYNRKGSLRREKYRTECMKHLTFLDYDVLEARGRSIEANLVEKASEIQALKEEMMRNKEQMAKMEESQLKITEMLEVMKIAKSSDGKLGKDMTMLDEKRRVTIGYIDDNNQRVEMKVPLDGFELDERVDVVTSHLPKRRVEK